MAEKPEDQFSTDEKIAKAKELYARGCRNYYVKSYMEAADDLSEASKLFVEEYGVDGDELGDVYLLYAKALIAVGQDENKLIDVPEEDEDDDDEEEGEPEPEPETVEGNFIDHIFHSQQSFNNFFFSLRWTVKAPDTNGTSENGVKTNGHIEEPQAGPSGEEAGPSNANDNESSNDAPDGEGEDDGEDGTNLELAWEVLLNAAGIYERQGTKSFNNLMDVYIEMGGISLENGNFEVAIKDFNRALDVFLDLEDEDQNKRIAAEVNYKIGLCQMMLKQYDDSVKSFQTAADLIEEVIAKEKARADQSEELQAKIKDLEETQQEILNKIIEIGDTKAEEIEQVKKELAKMFGPGSGAPSADGAGSSSSSSAIAAGSGSSGGSKPVEIEKPKPTDISHLIKRKKPDTDNAIEGSPAKRIAVDTSPGKPVAVDLTAEGKLAADETATVQVVEN